MDKLEKKILQTINQNHLIEKTDKIILGVSGGPDSMCMLNFFVNWLKNNDRKKEKQTSHQNRENDEKDSFPVAEIVVAHLNHQIRKEAEEEEQYVQKYCEKNGIEFYGKSIDIKVLAHTNKIGTEEAGRKARYEFFDEVLKKTKANKIAIAHNKNDKVETILFHILRGSGIDGLKGIEAKRGNVIRPLIDCERMEIENYCEQHQLFPKIDLSNFENIYRRNKIRNVVIPYIQKEFNPNIIKTIERLSDIVKLENEYIEKQMKYTYQELVIQENTKQIVIDLKRFNLQEIVIKSRLIRYIIKRLFGTTESIEKIHIEDMIKLCGNNIGNKYLIPNKNLKVFVKNHKIHFINLMV